MTLRTRYLLYILTLHLLLVGLTFRLLADNKPLFVASEGLIGLSIYAAIRIYRTFRQPAEFIASGIEAIRDKDFSIKFVTTGNSEVDELIRVYNLMIDQLRHERTRQAEQQFLLDKLVEAAPIALLIFDYDERIASANPKALALLRLPLSALLGRSLSTINHPLLPQLPAVPLDQPRTIKLTGVDTYRVLRGQFIDRGFRRQFLFIEELTAEIVETEKKAFGNVIRMMAHEVNNSIGAVNSILTIAESELTDADVKQAVRVAIERNDRLNLFMRRFADVVRLPLPNPAATDLSGLARNVARLMQPQADARSVTLVLTTPAEPVIGPVDVGQMEQVLVNVVKNALEACSAGHTVELLVTPRQVQIRNNGAPIPAGTAVHLFDPFYSTKRDGQGIGLTLTREILLNHGFSFLLRSGPDGWTVFTIRFRPADLLPDGADTPG